jgi:hypothetical protein
MSIVSSIVNGLSNNIVTGLLNSTALDYLYLISEQTDILAASPFELTIADLDFFDEDDGVFAIRYQAPATAIDFSYLVIANDGTSNNTIGIREDADADIRGYTRTGAVNINTDSNDDIIIRNNTCVAIYRFSNTGSDILSNNALSETVHGDLGNGMTKINIGSRNAGGNAVDLTVYEAIYIKGVKTLSEISNIAYKSTDFLVAGGGQSLIGGYFSSQADSSNIGQLTFRTNLGNSAGSNAAVFVDGATGSSAAVRSASNDSNYWVDLSDDSLGSAFTNFYTQVNAIGLRPNVLLWGQGEQDSFQIGVETTQAQYKEALLFIFNSIRSTYGNVQIFIQRIGRRSSFTNTGGVQAVRDVQQELIDEYSWIHQAAEVYDLGLTDAVHLDNAGYTTAATRTSNKMLSVRGYSVTGSVDGASLVSASRSGTTVTVTIAHDAGTDFTPTTGIEGFSYFDDGVEVTINSAIRTNETTITLTLNSTPTGEGVVYYGYDAMVGINTANIIKDNSATTLPLQTGKVVVT